MTMTKYAVDAATRRIRFKRKLKLNLWCWMFMSLAVGFYILFQHHRSEEHTSELQSHLNLVCRLLLEKTPLIYSPALQLGDSWY